MYVVIETCEREACRVETAASLAEGIAKANRMLGEHCGDLGPSYEEAHEDYLRELASDPDTDYDGISAAVRDGNSANAWCNWGNYDYDVHVMPVPDPVTGRLPLDGGFAMQPLFANAIRGEDGRLLPGDMFNTEAELLAVHPDCEILFGWCIVREDTGMIPEGFSDWHFDRLDAEDELFMAIEAGKVTT